MNKWKRLIVAARGVLGDKNMCRSLGVPIGTSYEWEKALPTDCDPYTRIGALCVEALEEDLEFWRGVVRDEY